MKVTLESLRADFLEAFCSMTRIGKPENFSGQTDDNIYGMAEEISRDYPQLIPLMTGIVSCYGEVIARVCLTADLLLIARDHGLNAAMLYKLSDGAIDPREEDSNV